MRPDVLRIAMAKAFQVHIGYYVVIVKASCRDMDQIQSLDFVLDENCAVKLT